MKKNITLFLCLLFCLSLTACKEQEDLIRPIHFYYPVSEMGYDNANVALTAEIREGVSWNGWEDILTEYLRGPVDPTLKSPFPIGLCLVSCELYNNVFYVTLSDEISNLSGLKLTIACCAMARTCLDMTGAESVSISAEKGLLDGEKAINLTEKDILLLDHVQQKNQ